MTVDTLMRFLRGATRVALPTSGIELAAAEIGR
jgi:hypothetical protein